MARRRRPLHTEKERRGARLLDDLKRGTRVGAIQLALVRIDEGGSELAADAFGRASNLVGDTLERAGLLRGRELGEVAIRDPEFAEPLLETARVCKRVLAATDPATCAEVTEEIRPRLQYRGEEAIGVEAVYADRGDTF